mgnify:CR=1 FL=1
MKKRKKNLRQILIPAFIITACIPLAIFALISQERLKTSTLENMNNQAEADLQKANQSLNMTLDKYETLLYAITTDEEFLSLVVNANDSEEIPEADAYNMRRDFAHICNRNEGVDGIQLVLSDKRRIFYDRLSSSSVNSTWMEKVKIPDETKLLSYDVDKDTDNPERMFHIGRKVVNYWDISEDLGYVILSVNLDELESVLSAGKGSRVYLVKDGVIDFTDIDITEEEIKKYSQIYIVACGSAWHVGVEAQYVIEELAQIPVRVELASEFRYREMPLVKDGLVIVISQSGETADTLAAMRMAKDKGLATLAVVNVIGSSIAREADKVFYTLAGPEISVATTKGYSAQLVALDCISVQFAKVKGLITDEQYSYYISELQTIPEKIEKILQDKERIQWFAAKYANAHDVFFVGRGVDYAVCLEGSLKLKEISYIHSEAYAAGELKHGTISLIEDNILVIGVLTQSKLYEKTVSNMMECKSRGAYLMGVTNYGNYEMEDKVDFTVYVPKVDEHFMGSLAVIPLQLLGYYVSVAKGLDVDKPRNLAKSVTVE